MHFNEISGAVVDSAMKVHAALGPGLPESVYEARLVHELRKCGFRTAAQLPLPVNYDGGRIDLGFRVDILVENTVVVEIKAVDAITAVLLAQLITFLKLCGKYVGLLMNFNVVHLRDGIRRMVQGEPPSAPPVSGACPERSRRVVKSMVST